MALHLFTIFFHSFPLLATLLQFSHPAVLGPPSLIPVIVFAGDLFSLSSCKRLFCYSVLCICFSQLTLCALIIPIIGLLYLSAISSLYGHLYIPFFSPKFVVSLQHCYSVSLLSLFGVLLISPYRKYF